MFKARAIPEILYSLWRLPFYKMMSSQLTGMSHCFYTLCCDCFCFPKRKIISIITRYLLSHHYRQHRLKCFVSMQSACIHRRYSNQGRLPCIWDVEFDVAVASFMNWLHQRPKDPCSPHKNCRDSPSWPCRLTDLTGERQHCEVQ